MYKNERGSTMISQKFFPIILLPAFAAIILGVLATNWHDGALATGSILGLVAYVAALFTSFGGKVLRKIFRQELPPCE
jgi:hypothetical protein